MPHSYKCSANLFGDEYVPKAGSRFRAKHRVTEDALTYGSLSAQHAFHETDNWGCDVNSINWPYLSDNDIVGMALGVEVSA